MYAGFKYVFKALVVTLVLVCNQAWGKTCFISSLQGEIESLDAYKHAISAQDCKQGDTLWIEILGGKSNELWDTKKGKLYWLYWLRANVCSLDSHSYVNEVNGWAGLTCVYKKPS